MGLPIYLGHSAFAGTPRLSTRCGTPNLPRAQCFRWHTASTLLRGSAALLAYRPVFGYATICNSSSLPLTFLRFSFGLFFKIFKIAWEWFFYKKMFCSPLQPNRISHIYFVLFHLLRNFDVNVLSSYIILYI